MEELIKATKTLKDVEDAMTVLHMNAVCDVLGEVRGALEVYVAPDRAKRQKIRDEMTWSDRVEMSAEIDRYGRMKSLCALMDKPDDRYPGPTIYALREYGRHHEPALHDINALLEAYLSEHEHYLAMDGETYMAALLCVDDNVCVATCSKTHALTVFNATKNIALRIAGGCVGPVSITRTRFLQNGSVDAALPDNSHRVLASFFDGSMPSDVVCGIASGKREQDGLADLLLKPFLQREAWWKGLFSLLMAWATYGDYSITDSRDSHHDDNSWAMIVADVVSIYCYREPDGVMGVMCFSDLSHDEGMQDGVEMYETHAMYEWTRETLRATVANLQTRTLAMLDRKPWFRDMNKLWEDVESPQE